jgi:hypothetical protein
MFMPFIIKTVNNRKQMRFYSLCSTAYFCVLVNMNQKNTILFVLLIIAVGCLRLAIDIPNLSPIGAIALMGGFYFKNKLRAWLLPLLSLFISDAILALSGGSYAEYFLGTGMIAVYMAFGLTIWIGHRMKSDSGSNIFLYGTASAVMFFLITNFAAWLGSGLYALNLSGLLQSYIAGLAFYRQEVFGSFFLNFWMGTLAFSFVIALVSKLALRNETSTSPA